MIHTLINIAYLTSSSKQIGAVLWFIVNTLFKHAKCTAGHVDFVICLCGYMTDYVEDLNGLHRERYRCLTSDLFSAVSDNIHRIHER